MGTAAPPAPPGRTGLVERLRQAVGEPGSARRLLASSGAWNVATFVATAVAAFLLRPFVVGALGDARFGTWSLVGTLSGMLGLADLGVRPAVVHFVARHDARGEIDEVNRYVATAFAVFAAVGGVVVVLAAALAPFVPAWFDVPASAAREAAWALVVVGVDVAAALPLNALSAVVVAKQRYDVLSRANLAALALRCAAIVLLLRAGHGLVALALANLASTLLELGWKARAAYALEPRLSARLALADRAHARDLLRYGGYASVVAVSLLLVWKVDDAVVAATVSLSAVTWFGNGASLPGYARQLALASSRALEPASGAAGGRDDVAAIRAMTRRTSRVLLLLVGPILAYFLVAGDAFLARWLGAHHRPESTTVLHVLAIGVAAPIASYPFVAVMYGTNRMKALAALALGEALGNLALSLALARPLGIVGVALGTAVPALLVHLVLVPAYVGRGIGLRWTEWARDAWPPALVAGAVACGALRLACPPGSRPGWPGLVLLAVFSLAAYYAASIAVEAARARVRRPA
jgi:O-antigen/teichoic acid export membrane protein